MPTLQSLLIYIGLYAVAVIVPGPGIVAIVARALGSGFRSTLPAIAGNTLGDWVLMTLSALGLALVAKALGPLFLAVKLAGAAYLLYMAWKYWTAPVDEVGDVLPSDARRAFLSQLALTLGNPKAIAFFVALLPAAIDLKHLTVPGYLILSVVGFVLIPVVMLSYAALASRLRGLLANRQARKGVNRGAAVVMAGASVGVVVS
jgi:threonine/homoserine/homoserine lactone efflux protein